MYEENQIHQQWLESLIAQLGGMAGTVPAFPAARRTASMPKKPGIPSLRRHRPRSLGVVTLDGRDCYLGRWPAEMDDPPADSRCGPCGRSRSGHGHRTLNRLFAAISSAAAIRPCSGKASICSALVV